MNPAAASTPGRQTTILAACVAARKRAQRRGICRKPGSAACVADRGRRRKRMGWAIARGPAGA
jgi:hypothetical protein